VKTPSRTKPAFTSTECSSTTRPYEIPASEDVGLSRSHLVLGKHSGRHAFRERVSALGFELDELEFTACSRIQGAGGQEEELFDGDIEALVLRSEGSASGPWTLIELATEARSNSPARALVRLQHSDVAASTQRRGRRPGDAGPQGHRGRDRGSAVVLRSSSACGIGGRDAQGEARVYVEYNHKSYRVRA